MHPWSESNENRHAKREDLLTQEGTSSFDNKPPKLARILNVHSEFYILYKTKSPPVP